MAAVQEENKRMIALTAGPQQVFISVWSESALFLEALNSTIFAANTMLYPRGRTVLMDPDIIREICLEVILACAPEAGRRDDFIDIIRDIWHRGHGPPEPAAPQGDQWMDQEE
jgi:hypothetical protein